MKKFLTFLILLFLAVTAVACGAYSSSETLIVTVTFIQQGYADIEITVNKNEPLTDIPAVQERVGYTVAWEDKDFSVISENITVHAIETPNEYNVYYDANGGTVETETETFTYDAPYALPVPVRKGYIFDYWEENSAKLELSGVWNVADDVVLKAVWKDNLGNLLDFSIEVETGRDIKILQLTDTQVIDPGQCRYPERLNGYTTPITDEILYGTCLSFIEQAIDRTDPDLIIVTGDIIYGEFDDNGVNFQKIVDFIDGFDIPWAPVFGNHDNESAMGVTWQCNRFIEAENCLFKRGELTGNGNYNVGIFQGGKLVKVIYMMDSNGCGNAYTAGETVKTSIGFGADQKNWLRENAQAVDTAVTYPVTKFIAFHVPIAEFAYAAYAAGYQSDNSLSNTEKYTIGETVAAKNGDFGTKGEIFKSAHVEDGLWDILKTYNFDGVFVGHSHLNNVSILYDGIRLTFGLKTGIHDRYPADTLGGTLTTIKDGTFKVSHVNVVSDSQLTDNPWFLRLGSSNSLLTKFKEYEGKSDVYMYFNGTTDASASGRMLYLDQKMIGEEDIDSGRLLLSFDVFIDADYDYSMGSDAYFLFKVKSGGKSTYFTMNGSNIVKGAWSHCEIDLTTVPNYLQLCDDATEIGFYTPSQSTIYITDIQLN